MVWGHEVTGSSPVFPTGGAGRAGRLYGFLLSPNAGSIPDAPTGINDTGWGSGRPRQSHKLEIASPNLAPVTGEPVADVAFNCPFTDEFSGNMSSAAIGEPKSTRESRGLACESNPQ